MSSAENPFASGIEPGTEKGKRSRLVVCFDGTGNQYMGDTSDTNIVKLYQKLDRANKDQFHYYQRKLLAPQSSPEGFATHREHFDIAGIGTYTAGEHSVNTGVWGKCKRWLSQTLDQGIGTSFDAHVIAGYRFVMRYYDEDDRIYIFGFSRGAFTARFLARMIGTIGVLSKGNEEMVPFAYRSYQDYENGMGRFKSAEAHQKFMTNFKKTFCRVNAKVHFLGLFDTVNSVGTFDVPFTRRTYLPTVLGTADHIRHAVSIDERRLKFKPALLVQDQQQAKNNVEDIKEVFFVGNHGDIGGGWAALGDSVDNDESNDPVQLSDLPLAWMIGELQNLETDDGVDNLAFNENVDVFLQNFRSKEDQALTAPIHDPLRFGGGLSWTQVIFWNIMGESAHVILSFSPSVSIQLLTSAAAVVLEYIPFFKRLELIDDQWKPMYFPPSMGAARDIPAGATLHPSVIKRARTGNYRPRNQGLEYLKAEGQANGV